MRCRSHPHVTFVARQLLADKHAQRQHARQEQRKSNLQSSRSSHENNLVINSSKNTGAVAAASNSLPKAYVWQLAKDASLPSSNGTRQCFIRPKQAKVHRNRCCCWLFSGEKKCPSDKNNTLL